MIPSKTKWGYNEKIYLFWYKDHSKNKKEKEKRKKERKEGKNQADNTPLTTEPQ